VILSVLNSELLRVLKNIIPMKKAVKSTITLASILMLLAFSCKTNNEKSVTTNEQSSPKSIYLVKFTDPSNGTLYKLGEEVKLTLKLQDVKIVPDSVVIFCNSNKVGKLVGLNYTLRTSDLSLGTQVIRATAYKDGLYQTASISIKLKSNIKPKQYTYRVVKTYPHDPDAYTQGLFYKDGFLYEGTGQKGSSSIRKVELETGKVLQSINLESKHFGEGIALFNDKIYQLTWTSQIGFVYDISTFKQVSSFSYPTQGWGLTNNDKELIMSDGSNIIHFMEPANFAELHRIEVFDDNDMVDSLNELELINGDIFANIYTTDRMAIISPVTGIVKGIIDFKGLLKDSDRKGKVDYLNGVAWDEAGKRLFVTGKLWPKLYQVEIIEK